MTTKSQLDEKINKTVTKAVKFIKSAKLDKSEYDNVAKMFAMELAQKTYGSSGPKYSEGFKSFKTILLKKIKEKIPV